MFGIGLHETPNMSDVGENELKRGNSQLFDVLRFLHLDLRVSLPLDMYLIFSWGGACRRKNLFCSMARACDLTATTIVDPLGVRLVR